MSKLLSTLVAGAAALALSGMVHAADNNSEPARDTGKDLQNQSQGAPVEQGGKDVTAEGRDGGRDAGSQGQSAGTVNEGNTDVNAQGRDPNKEQYQVELKKCDSMTGGKKKNCTDAAKKKYGQM